MKSPFTFSLSHFVSAALALALTGAVGADEKVDPNKPEPQAIPPEEGSVPAALIQLGAGQYFSNHAFVMDKSHRTLSVWKQEGGGLTLVKAVPADFGRNAGAKITSGDARTPEGIYFFQQLKEGPQLNFEEYGVRAFTLDYPNFFDVLEKKSGSGIWLHAIPDSKSLWRGSRGCVVVRNQVIQELSPFISLKRTPILIQDAVQYVARDQSPKIKQNWQTWIESWRKSWESKDISNYIARYADTFKALGMNKDQWRQFKKDLSEKYGFIKVALTEPIVIANQDEAVIRFLQDYQSDKNSDFGEKTLYLRRIGEEFKIIGEEWQVRRREGYVANH